MSFDTISRPTTTLIRRIMCPIDFSDPSKTSFEYAERLARDLQAALVLVHAFDTPETLTHAGQSRPADADLKFKLESIRPSSENVAVSHVLHAGSPGEVICWLAEQRQCDLIIMGTHGRTGLKHLFLGSVAEFVMRHARCPVLTIRTRPSDEPLPKEPLVLPAPAPKWM